jgi:hypothetical protein
VGVVDVVLGFASGEDVRGVCDEREDVVRCGMWVARHVGVWVVAGWGGWSGWYFGGGRTGVRVDVIVDMHRVG